MTTSTLLTICTATFVIAAGISTFYFVRVFKLFASVLKESEEILKEAKPQIHHILWDVSDSTSSSRQVVAKIDKTIGNLFSLSEFARILSKHTLRLLKLN